MIWDGSVEMLAEVRKQHPSAIIYATQTRLGGDAYIFDPLYGEPVLVIEDRAKQPGRVFEVGMEVE